MGIKIGVIAAALSVVLAGCGTERGPEDQVTYSPGPIMAISFNMHTEKNGQCVWVDRVVSSVIRHELDGRKTGLNPHVDSSIIPAACDETSKPFNQAYIQSIQK